MFEAAGLRSMPYAASRLLVVTAVLLTLLLTSLTTLAREAAPVAADAQLEARVMTLAAELRCLVCQNQTIADSHAGLAVDLRQQIREMLAKGQTDSQVLDYMTQRYGDFVLYRPPFKSTTVLLWLAPGLLLALALGSLIVVLRRRQRLGDEAFDPDDDDVDAGNGHPQSNSSPHGAPLSPHTTAIDVQKR